MPIPFGGRLDISDLVTPEVVTVVEAHDEQWDDFWEHERRVHDPDLLEHRHKPRRQRWAW
jgi:hypothetical protein